MTDIMVRCPVRGETVSTSLSTNTVQFETLPDCAVPLQCPACGGVHYWRPHDAWVDDGSLEEPRSGLRRGRNGADSKAAPALVAGPRARH